MKTMRALAFAGLMLAAVLPAAAADYPAPKEADWVAKDFRFHTGETMPELRIHYTTVGNPAGEPVLVLHGTAGNGIGMVNAAFAGELFGPGQPLDATKYFIILPDAIGTGKTTKPSDGLKAKFPKYNYADMVQAQYRLVSEGLGIKRLRLIIGNSMGGMQTWLWAETHPDMMDAIVPMASQPTAMASRNWMLRRLMIETIKADPDYKDGNYTTAPKMLAIANTVFATATNGGNLAYQQQAPTAEKANKIVDERLAAPLRADANDFIWQWASSEDYDASAGLEKIKAAVLVINSADDERNPPESGIMEREMKRLKNGQLFLIPASADTRGHGTTANAKFWKARLQTFMDGLPKAAN